MTRCTVCSRCSTAGSLFFSDEGKPSLKPFHKLPDGSPVCASCWYEIRELVSEYTVGDEPEYDETQPLIDGTNPVGD